MTLREALNQDASLYYGHDFSYFDGKIRRRGQIEGIQVTEKDVRFRLHNVQHVYPSQHLRELGVEDLLLQFPAETKVSKFGGVIAYFCGGKVTIFPHKDQTLVSQG